MDTQKGLLWAGIGTLGTCALFAVLFFWIGAFEDLEVRLLLTCFTIGGYCLTTSVSMGVNQQWTILCTSVAIVGIFFSLHLVWMDRLWNLFFEFETTAKITAILAILSFSWANASLLRKALVQNKFVQIVAGFTAILTGLQMILFVGAVLSEFDLERTYYKILATVTIFWFLGNVIMPFAKKLAKPSPVTSS